MTNILLKQLQELDTVAYIYQRDASIYNVPVNNYEFLVIVKKEFLLPKELKQYKKYHERIGIFTYDLVCDNCIFKLNTCDEWFTKVQSCSIEAWECACLNKKFIYKEIVKLLMTTDLYKLNRNFFSFYNVFIPSINNKNLCIKVIKDLKFSLQIIENHKIVNFNVINNPYIDIMKCETDEQLSFIFYQYIKEDLKMFHKLTDGVIESAIKKRANNKTHVGN